MTAYGGDYGSDLENKLEMESRNLDQQCNILTQMHTTWQRSRERMYEAYNLLSTAHQDAGEIAS